MMIGCEFHPRFQQIASVDPETGECGALRLNHPDQAEQFYRSLAGRPVRMGAEATGNFRWFRQLMQELGHEFLLGDPSAIRAASPRRQKTDKRDARHILSMLVEDRFPAVWQPPVENEDPRQLLLPRSTPASKDRLPGTPVVPPQQAKTACRGPRIPPQRRKPVAGDPGLDVALRAELQAGDGARFVRGAVRLAQWPRLESRHPDWTPRLPCKRREFEQAIME
jgi:hypothetical protein